ncbi:DUF1127 domain-containing protein [Methylobacterium mesophilicum SR1.6/6]|uniref:DUF1127 domain-containing protein n=1 Tax=Methylobacterium mesophilicum SR1.6/6 TaxID=908290 RepID=A0A6B9FUJ5_9HYPH|nr:DUF1127 domain-containing protein [Methylobacterium mesophilicum]QGY04624.1 DUF1127 domain-containing protein [Methylobacterium mesophilicum SR1.6/6]
MDQCLSETAGTRPPWIARLAAHAAAFGAAVRAGLSRAAMNRRVLQRLSTLSERELKDIGLTPQDVADACAPGTGDAIDLLVGRRDERRHARAAWHW